MMEWATSWWWYVILGVIFIALIVWHYAKLGWVGGIWGAIAGVAWLVVLPPWIIGVDTLFAAPLIPVFIGAGLAVWLATIIAYACVFAVAGIILLIDWIWL